MVTCCSQPPLPFDSRSPTQSRRRSAVRVWRLSRRRSLPRGAAPRSTLSLRARADVWYVCGCVWTRSPPWLASLSPAPPPRPLAALCCGAGAPYRHAARVFRLAACGSSSPPLHPPLPPPRGSRRPCMEGGKPRGLPHPAVPPPPHHGPVPVPVSAAAAAGLQFGEYVAAAAGAGGPAGGAPSPHPPPPTFLPPHAGRSGPPPPGAGPHRPPPPSIHGGGGPPPRHLPPHPSVLPPGAGGAYGAPPPPPFTPIPHPGGPPPGGPPLPHVQQQQRAAAAAAVAQQQQQQQQQAAAAQQQQHQQWAMLQQQQHMQQQQRMQFRPPAELQRTSSAPPNLTEQQRRGLGSPGYIPERPPQLQRFPSSPQQPNVSACPGQLGVIPFAFLFASFDRVSRLALALPIGRPLCFCPLSCSCV